MYEFHYRYSKNKSGNNPRVLCAETDILMYEIKIEDVYEDFSNDKETFDFSNYSTQSKYYNSKKKKKKKIVVDKMKGETAGVPIV